MDEFIKHKLLNIYPDRVIISLHKHPSLYAQLRNRAIEKGLSNSEYIHSLGFNYRRKQNQLKLREKVSHNNLYGQVESLLLEQFPEKCINKLSDIAVRTNNLLLQLCREEDMKRVDIVAKLGFNVKTIRRGYDTVSMKRLYEEFSCSQTELAKWLGVNKQAISQKLTNNKKSTANWIVYDLDDRGHELLDTLLKQGEFSYEDQTTAFKIFNNKNRKIAIFYKNEESIRVLFDIPQEINKTLMSKGFDRYNKEELQLIEVLKKHVVYENYTRIKDNKLRIILRNAATKREMNQAEFIDFLGYRRLHPNKVTKVEIKETLKRFVVEGNMVHIPCDDPVHQNMANRASRAKFPSLEAFVRSFGFDYTSYYKEYMYRRKLNVFKEEIKKYIVIDNKIYIKSYDPIYVRLHAFAFKRGLKLNEVIEDLGYYRIHLEDLPKNFVPYDWRNDFKINVGADTEERYIELLKQYVIEEGSNKVYIYTEDPIYSRLFDLAVRKNVSVNGLLEQWGYERYYRPQLNLNEFPNDWPKGIEQYDYDEENNTTKIDKFDRLERLKDIQTNLEIMEVSEQRVKRSRALASELKRLYEYKCQLCDYEREHIPLIKMENQNYYIEVHHIKKISEWLAINEEEENLDTYKNVICLCAHHHKVVHYEDGGYNQLTYDEENNLHFLTKNGKILKVVTNYHLEVEGMFENSNVPDEILVLEEELEEWAEEMFETWTETNKPTAIR